MYLSLSTVHGRCINFQSKIVLQEQIIRNIYGVHGINQHNAYSNSPTQFLKRSTLPLPKSLIQTNPSISQSLLNFPILVSRIVLFISFYGYLVHLFIFTLNTRSHTFTNSSVPLKQIFKPLPKANEATFGGRKEYLFATIVD